MRPIVWNRRDFIKGLGLGAAGMAFHGCVRDLRHAVEKPNILFLFTDDQRFDTLGALGHPQLKTPNMDRLVEGGVAFTHCYIMGSPHGAVCMPSRAMLLTGRGYFHLPESVVQSWKVPLDERGRCPYITFPELFREHGYRAFGTGKWHNGRALYAKCFDEGANVFFGGMSDHWRVPVYDFDPSGQYPEGKEKTGAGHSSTLFADGAVDFIEDRRDTNPFLMYVAFTAPHDPRTAPDAFAKMYRPEEMELPPNFLPEHPFDNGELRVRDERLAPFPRTPEVVRRHIADYYAMISHVDAEIGRILDALQRKGLADETIVVLAGDNGLAVGQHGLLGKQSLYEHSVRVPLVLCGPGIPRGERRDQLCCLHDVFPTLCDLADIAVPDSVESRSLAPLLDDPGAVHRESVFLAYSNDKPQRGVRKGRWKYMVYNIGGKVTRQLFDLYNDPWEKWNLAGEPAYALRVREMSDLLQGWMRRSGDKVDWEFLNHETP